MGQVIERRISTAIILGILLATVAPLTDLHSASAQTSSLWIKSYGDIYSDYARSVVETPDGGFAVAGSTGSFGAEGGSDAWLLKLDSDGNVLWQEAYRGTNADSIFSLDQTLDGGFVAAGISYSFGDSSFGDLWVLRLDTAGNVFWQRAYGGDGGDWARSVEETADGGFVVVGNTESLSLGAEALGDGNVWILKLDTNGSIVRQKRYGTVGGSDYALSAQQTSDGGFVVAGVGGSFAGPRGLWVFRIDANWSIVWQRIYPAQGSTARSVRQTSDGGFIVVGQVLNSAVFLTSDYLVMRLDSDGNILWQKSYGAGADHVPNAVRQTSDGGFIIAGKTNSPPASGHYSPWLLKLDANGNISWSKVYSFPFADAVSVEQTSQGGLVAVAGAASGIGSPDFVVMKLDSNGDVSANCLLMQPFNATVLDTSVDIFSSSAISADTPVIAITTNAATINTSATVLTPCSTAPIPSPDLATDITKITNKKFAGKFRTAVEVKVANIGDASAPSTRLNIYLSQDAILDSGDIILGGKTLDSISSGSYVTTRFTFDFSMNSAGLWIIAQADAFNQVAEPDEANNVDSAQIPSFR